MLIEPQPLPLLAYSQTARRRMRGCFKRKTRTASQQTWYFQHDHLGSIVVITDEAGVVTERLAYDPWGKRRNASGTSDNTDSLVGLTTDRGYTEHEHLDEVGVIHMNGRVFDPYLGRFMSADPFIQAPFDLQSHNRYAYVMNNPLAFTDPSGYFGLFNELANLGSTVSRVWRQDVYGSQVGQIALMAGAAYFGYVNFATLGASTAAAGGQGIDPASFQRYAAHALVGCVSTVASGGNCGSGAAAAMVGKYITNETKGWNAFAQGVAASVSGGIGSVIAGGNFENGAKTAAYGYLFNQVMSELEKQARASRIRQNQKLTSFLSEGTKQSPENSAIAGEVVKALVVIAIPPLAAPAFYFDVLSIGVDLNKGTIDANVDAARTFTSVGVGAEVESGFKAKGIPSEAANRAGSSAGYLWDQFLKLFKD